MKDTTPDYSSHSLEELHAIANNSENTLFSRQYREVIKEIEKRERTKLSPAYRARRTLWLWLKWVPVIAFLVIVAENGAFFYHFSQRPPYEDFKVTQSFAKTLQTGDIAKLRSQNRYGVVVEGPCNGGCEGGIVPAAKIKNFLPQWQLSNPETTAIVWLVQVRPDAVRRRNDSFGEDEINIHGKPEKAGTVYFAAVPVELVRDRLQWVRVVVDDQ